VLDPHEGAFKYIEHRRRELVADLFWLKLGDPELNPTLDELTSIYVPWRDYPLFGAYEKEFPDGSAKTVGVKCRKRGNDVDCWVKKRSFKRASREIRKHAVFSRCKSPTRNPTYNDNIFWFTLTYNRSDLFIGEAWTDVSRHYHDYITWLIKHFGHLIPIRVFASHEDGYPHVHVLVVLLDTIWAVKEHKDKPRRGEKHGHKTLRLLRKRLTKNEELRLKRRGRPRKGTSIKKTDPSKDFLASGWPHGNIDIQGVKDTKRSVDYLLGYSSGYWTARSGKKKNLLDDQSLALAWAFRKQSYAIGNPDLMFLKETKCVIALLNLQKIILYLVSRPILPKTKLLGLVGIEFLDRPPPFTIDFEKFPLLKANVYE
jgi:hypothetical protein